MSTPIELSNRAERDLRRVGRGPDLNRIVQALEALGEGAANLDVKPLEGHPSWLRCRVGDYRILYRPTDWGLWVERIVNRRDLERAITTL
jgi:mRNA-degrading endonuclease RelE of RelBE toxin-antitoxin system